MVQAGEDLPLGAEAADDGVGVHAALEDLQRDALVEHVVVAHREEHGAHAALAQLAHEPVGPDSGAVRPARGGLDSGEVVWVTAHALE